MLEEYGYVTYKLILVTEKKKVCLVSAYYKED